MHADPWGYAASVANSRLADDTSDPPFELAFEFVARRPISRFQNSLHRNSLFEFSSRTLREQTSQYPFPSLTIMPRRSTSTPFNASNETRKCTSKFSTFEPSQHSNGHIFSQFNPSSHQKNPSRTLGHTEKMWVNLRLSLPATGRNERWLRCQCRH